MIVGSKIGCWEVTAANGAKITCKCDCGTIKVLRRYDLVQRNTLMCKRCSAKISQQGHGGSSGDPTYSSYSHALSRCHNPQDKDYPNYGGRGITMCQLWRDSYASFLMQMGPRPAGTTLDREDYNGNYEKSNCAWKTIKEQNCNQRSNIRIEYLGQSKVLSEWIEELGLQDQEAAIRKRINRGADPLEAMLTPIKARK